MTFELLAGILSKGLGILEEKEKTRFQRLILEIQEDRAQEERKPSYEERHKYPDLKLKDFRDNAVLDDCFRRLCELGKAFISTPGK